MLTKQVCRRTKMSSMHDIRSWNPWVTSVDGAQTGAHAYHDAIISKLMQHYLSTLLSKVNK